MYLEFFYCNDLLYFCLIEEKAEMCCFIVGFIKSIIKLHTVLKYLFALRSLAAAFDSYSSSFSECL